MTGNDWFGSQVIRWKSIKETESPSIQLRSGQTEVMWGCEFRLILAQGANCSSLVNIEDQDQWPVWDQAHAYIAYSLFSISPPVADQLNEESNVKCHLTWLFLATEISLDAKCLGGELILCLTDYCQNTDKKKVWADQTSRTRQMLVCDCHMFNIERQAGQCSRWLGPIVKCNTSLHQAINSSLPHQGGQYYLLRRWIKCLFRTINQYHQTLY